MRSNEVLANQFEYVSEVKIVGRVIKDAHVRQFAGRREVYVPVLVHKRADPPICKKNLLWNDVIIRKPEDFDLALSDLKKGQPVMVIGSLHNKYLYADFFVALPRPAYENPSKSKRSKKVATEFKRDLSQDKPDF